MAALQKIRNKAGLLIGIIAIALLAFIFPWSELTSFINRQKDKAFVVNGEIVPTGTYLNRINQFENLQKLISNQSSLDASATAQIREFVYEQMVKEMILDEEAEKIGLSVSDEEMREMTVGENISPILRQLPLFTDPQTGQFSKAAFNNFISIVNTDINSVPDQEKARIQEVKDYWTTIQNTIKYQRLEEKYNTLLSSAVIINDLDAKVNSDATSATSDMLYTIERYSTIADSTITVEKSEIEKLYNLRKNNFKNPQDLRIISFFAKEIVPSENDFETVKNEIETAREKLASSEHPALIVADYSDIPYQDIFFTESQLLPEDADFLKTASVGDINGPIRYGDAFRVTKLVDKTIAPDSIKLRMISIPEGLDRTLSNNQADSIINVIKQGKDFALVANEIYPQSNGGEIGWITEAHLTSMGKDFAEACFGSAAGEIRKFNLQGQIQIVNIEDKTKPVTKYKVALIHMPVVVSEQTLANIDNEINEFVANNSDGKNFAKAAQDKGYNIVQDQRITSSQQSIGNINGSRQVVNWAFTEKPGTIKKFDLNDEYRIVALINSKISAGYLPVSEVSNMLKAEIVKDKKAEKMIANLKSKNLTSLDAYAEAMNSKIDTVKFVTFNTPNIMGIGRESALNVYAEIGEVNKLEGPVKGDNGVIALSIINKNAANKDSFNAEATKSSLNNQNMYRIMSQAMYILKDKMNVLDNRTILF